MALFYKVPPDLAPTYRLVQGIQGHIAGLGKFTPPGLVEELMPEVVAELQAARSRLNSEGRQKDLKAFKKYVLKVGGFMDNAPYNKVFYPMVNENL